MHLTAVVCGGGHEPVKLNQHHSCAFALRSQSEIQSRTLRTSEFWASLCAVICRRRLLKECKYYYRYNYCFPIFNTENGCNRTVGCLISSQDCACLIALLNWLCTIR